MTSIVHARACIRHDKLNSQFIVTKISILHAGGGHFSYFKPVLQSAGKLNSNLKIAKAPLISTVGGWGSKCHVYCIEYDKFLRKSENLCGW